MLLFYIVIMRFISISINVLKKVKNNYKKDNIFLHLIDTNLLISFFIYFLMRNSIFIEPYFVYDL